MNRRSVEPPSAPRGPRRTAFAVACCCAASAALAILTFGSVSLAQGQAQPSTMQDVVAPIVVHHVDAVYPPSALAQREHADVVLALTVDVDGHVSKVTVLESAAPDLDEAAVVAARQWTFVPAMRGGKPIASRIRVPFHFAPPAPPPEIVAPAPPPQGEPELPPSQAVPQATPATAPASPAPKASPAEAPAPASDIAEVDVHGRAPPPNVGASDFNLRIGSLAAVPRANATELLKLAPGILLTNEGGEGHAEQVFLRGFDAREGQDIEFSVGGVPINESGNLHGNGYADTHFIIPELVERLRVVEGPFDPRQGNYAVAGSADYELGLEKRGFTAKYTTGSYGTQRGLLLWGPAGESQHTFGGAEVYSTDGFGQNRDAVRGTAMGQYEGTLGARGTYRITVQGYATHFHSAGLIRQDDYQAGRIGFYDSYDLSSFAREQVPEGGDSSRFSAAADLETRVGDTTLTQQVFAIKRDMRLLENFTGFLLDVQEPLQTVHDQRGDMIDLNVHEVTLGARGAARWHTRALGEPQELEFGYFIRGDAVGGTQQRLEASTGVPYKTDTDLDSQLGDLGLYADANLRATHWVNLRGGVRADALTYDVLDNCAAQTVAHPSTTNPPIDQSCLTQQDMGFPREPNQQTATASVAVLPRASLLVGPFAHFMASASYGRGVRSIDPSYITQDVQTPFASINAYEGGVSYTGDVRGASLVARSIFFQTSVDRDYIFDQTVGRNVLGVGTHRTGWVGALRLTGSFFDESANLTLVRATYDDTHLLVAYIPGTVLRSDTAFFSELPLRLLGSPMKGALSLGITYVGPRPLPFGEESEDTFTIDTSATLEWKNYEIGLVITNLLDTKYRLGEYNYASDFRSTNQPPTLVPERMFSAGAPRQIFATFAIRVGGT
ncbi:MAG TPA: TonB family protein [Polyangiaceae bacterium]|jgi:TonB family protein